MFDFIPVYNYTHYFDIAVLILILIAFWQCSVGSILRKDVSELNATWGFVIAIILILYMGLRPVGVGLFGDSMMYAAEFRRSQLEPIGWDWNKEWLFYNMMRFISHYTDVHAFFVLCAALYILPLWLASHRIFKNYSYIPFLIFLSMFTFWNYGVNGIRNGIGASFIILAMTYVENIPVMITLCFIATGFHSSVFLMIGAGLIAWFIKNSNLYLAGWIICVILSYSVGETIQSYLGGLGLGTDERFTRYVTTSAEEFLRGEGVAVITGFRWDFIAYSSMAVIVGWYFIYRENFKDEYYKWIYNSFLITNAFWVLIIRAIYSNRFAQISWFIMPLVLIYPFMKKRFWLNHEKVLGYTILIFYAFAFYTNVLK